MKMTPPSSSSPLEDTRVSPPDAPLSSSSRISVADMYPILVTHGNTAQPPVVFQDAVHKRAPFSALPNTRAGAIDDATTKPDSNESWHKARPTKRRSLLTASLAVARHRGVTQLFFRRSWIYSSEISTHDLNASPILPLLTVPTSTKYGNMV